MNTRHFAAIVAAAMIVAPMAYAAETPSPATQEARLLSGKYVKVIKDADVERMEREHRLCDLHRIYATSAFVQEQYQKSNVVVLMKLNGPWYEFNDWRLGLVLDNSAKAIARELTRRLRSGIFFPSRCEYREETENGWFLQAVYTGSKGDIAHALRLHLRNAKIADNGKDPAIAGRTEIRKAIEAYAASVAPSLKKRWLVEVKGEWCDAAGALWHYLSVEAIEPSKLGLTQAEAVKLEDLARQQRQQ